MTRWQLPSLVIGLALIEGVLSAAPPPPIPPGHIDVAIILANAVNARDEDAYAALMDSQVQISEEGVPGGVGFPAIRSMFRRWIGKSWKVQVLTIAEGGDEIVAMERVSNLPDTPLAHTTVDCCWWVRTVSYHINAAHHIDRLGSISFFKAANIRQLSAN